MLILGIESSCDETAFALYDDSLGLLAHVVASQIPLHQLYGGVVPELASRDHIRKTIPLLEEVLQKAKRTLVDVDAIAYTAGPGLIGALLVGATFACGLAFALGKPAIPIHHLEAHLLAPFLEDTQPTCPFLALLVSGGHTLLAIVKEIGRYEMIGETKDDAAGEAFDKTAKLLGLPYPGGPELAKLAATGRANIFKFPRPLLHSQDLMFSFSGLKTAALQTWQASDQSEQTKADIAHAFQEAVIDVLCSKSVQALKQYNLKQLVIAGGVSANVRLREELKKRLVSINAEVFYPRLEFCTDNAAMVAYAGAMKYKNADVSPVTKIYTRSHWPLPSSEQ